MDAPNVSGITSELPTNDSKSTTNSKNNLHDKTVSNMSTPPSKNNITLRKLASSSQDYEQTGSGLNKSNTSVIPEKMEKKIPMMKTKTEPPRLAKLKEKKQLSTNASKMRMAKSKEAKKLRNASRSASKKKTEPCSEELLQNVIVNYKNILIRQHKKKVRRMLKDLEFQLKCNSVCLILVHFI